MSPEEIQQREFTQQRRGYDKIEVRDFLNRVAAQVSAAQETSSSHEVQSAASAAPLSPEDDRFEALGDRIAGLLRSAHESAAAVKENADSEAKATVEIAREASELMRLEAAEAADAMRIAAANDAASERTAAEDEAEQIRAQARAAAETANQESERLRAEAEQYKAETEADVDAFKVETETRVLEFKSTTETTAAEHKATVEAEVAEHKATVEAEVAEFKATTEAELAEFKATTEAEAAELREASLNAGETELADKRAETDRLLAEAQAERETAMNELADARAQVTDLLEEARNQSDFLRHEADEIIRGKVRTQVERAEERLQVLRNSEVASRDRIATAHAELTAAMERLDSSPVPELAPDTDVEVLEAAKARGEETNWGGALSAPQIGELDAVDTDAVEADVVEAEAIDTDVVQADVVEAEAIDTDVVEADVNADVTEAEVNDQGDITMAEVFGGTDGTDLHVEEAADAVAHETNVVEAQAVDAFDAAVEETDIIDEPAMPAPPVAPVASLGDSAIDADGSGADMSSENVFADHTPIEADESELLNTFEVDASTETSADFESADLETGDLETAETADADTAEAFGIDTFESPATEAPGFEGNSFTNPSAFGDTVDHGADRHAGLRHDDPAPVVEESTETTGFDQFNDKNDDSSDRVPVGVGAADVENTVPENEDALARLVREAMQRAVDSARTGD